MVDVMRVAILSANLGGIDRYSRWVTQSAPGYEFDVHVWTDANFPPRRCMSPRLQSRIPKMLGWQMAPGYDIYIWVDASFSITHPGSMGWLLSHMGDADMVCFKHQHRTSVAEENSFIKSQIAAGDEYLRSRYENELGDAEVAEILGTPGYVDDRLLVGGIFAYRNIPQVRAAMLDWWYHTSRYHCVDQIGFPYVLWKQSVNVAIIPGYYAPKPYFKRWRHNG
jgi:hypothetical protein